MLPEGRLEDRPHVLLIGTGDRLTPQQITAVRVTQGERIAPPAVSGAEPAPCSGQGRALEIGAPHVVGRRHRGKRLRVGRTTPPPPRPTDQPLVPQPIPDSTRRRDREFRMERAELHPQLLRSPSPALAQIHHRLHHRDIMGLAMAQRRVRALPQARRAVTAIPPEPLIAGLAADPVLSAQRRHRILAGQNPSDKLRPFVHLTGLFPWHRQAPPADSPNLSPIHPVNSVTNLPGSYRIRSAHRPRSHSACRSSSSRRSFLPSDCASGRARISSQARRSRANAAA